MPKKKTDSVAPWEVTEDMFLTEREAESLLRRLRDRERTADSASRAKATTDRLIVELLLYSGLRNSELCHLRVVDTQIGHGQSAVRVAGTPRQDRLVFIPESLTSELLRYVNDVRPLCVPEGIASNDVMQPLILNERGRSYDRTALYRRVVRIVTDAGLGDRASVQLLRHTYGFLAYKRTGGNLLFVQRQMGHAHPMVTAVYAQFVQFSDVELANRVSTDSRPSAQTNARRPVKSSRTKGSKR